MPTLKYVIAFLVIEMFSTSLYAMQTPRARCIGRFLNSHRNKSTLFKEIRCTIVENVLCSRNTSELLSQCSELSELWSLKLVHKIKLANTTKGLYATHISISYVSCPETKIVRGRMKHNLNAASL